MRALIAALSLAFLMPRLALADEGLWTFDNVPTAKVKAALGVDITPAWLAKVQAAAVRLSVGCSASVVSGDGLTLTNNHCVTDCTHDITPPGAAYRATGFLAARRDDEKTCPGMEADILVSITDVTGRISAAGAGLTGSALVKTRNAAISDIAAEVCGADKRLLCQVVDLYQGGQFKLYKYRKYTDVRLVFAPGDQAAFFGGDPDNFNFPRFNLDCAFLRLYEDGKPMATPAHLRFNPAPPVVGQPVFTAGNPGQTFRDLSVAQLETQRDVGEVVSLTLLSELRGRFIAFGETGPDNKRVADEALDELENGFKVTRGRLLALDDPSMMAAKRAGEAELETRAKATLEPDLGDPWADLAAIQPAAKALYLPNRFMGRGPDSTLFDYARQLVRAAEERTKPSASRLPEYADNRLPGLEHDLLDARPIEPAAERINLEFWLSKLREYLGADDPDTKLVLGKESPEGLADRLAGASRLADPALRKQLWDGGMAAINASTDPMIQFALKIDPEARRIREAYEEQVSGPTAKASEAIARARFRIYGDSLYPDGTFTLRLSYGAVGGWTYQGKTVPAVTTFAGLWDRATGAPPFDVDPRWDAARSQLTPDTVFNFVTTNDIIGGNSGSPLLNAKAEVIGAAFDGNIHSLAGDYWFDPALNRTVVVSSAAIAEALKKIYSADALLKELSGG